MPPHSTTIASQRRAGGGPRRPRRPARSRPSTTARRRKASSAHRAAVAAQDEQRRRRRPARASAVLDECRRALDDRQDRGVDRGAHGPRLEPVGAGELVAGAGGRPEPRARARRPPARARACRPRRPPLTAIAVQPRPRRRSRAASIAATSRPRGGVEELVLGAQLAPGGELDLADPGAPAGDAAGRAPRRCRSRRPCATSPSSSAFIACVVEKATSAIAAAVLAELVEQASERLDDPLGDAGLRRRGWSGPRPGRQPQVAGIERHGLGEGAADVDADPQSGPRAASTAGSTRSSRAAPPRAAGAAGAPGGSRTPRRRRRVDGQQRRLDGDPLHGRVDAGQLGEEDRQPRPARHRSASPPITSTACSERTALPAKATESSSRIDAPVISSGLIGSFRRARRSRSRRPRARRGRHRAPSATQSIEALGEEGQRLVEEHRLEALAIDRGEAEPGEGDRAAGGDRGRDARAHELHPVPLLEPRDQPERDQRTARRPRRAL